MPYSTKQILIVLAIIFAVASYFGIPTLGVAVILVCIANLIA